ncbi:HAMP domain-containing sensor histidine kinase [uncultured Endozoicomonas sp.]|uniref:sensor histidine kinase n=1 Tax=uncultured Endozoicomonas sp. TaxID=432652 RepID=UPI00261085C2|nr:HAMP domain-containing sensor histidine kinase [uncultured Endozoicomonas sp.]
MSSGSSVERALSKVHNTLLRRFILLLLLCLLVVQVIVGSLFFLDLYWQEKRVMTNMRAEYQRILTYDSADRLRHVFQAGSERLLGNHIAAFERPKKYVQNNAYSIELLAGYPNVPSDIDFSLYTIGEKPWWQTFLLNPYTTYVIPGVDSDFWLVLDNRARYFIAYNKWVMTLLAMVLIVIVTTVFIQRMIRGVMSPLISLGKTLSKIQQGDLNPEAIPKPVPGGLSVISASVHDAMVRLHQITTTLNTTVDAIAHDIRTPLSRIILSSQSALLDDQNPQQMREALSDSAEYAMQANTMLTTLMKLNDELTGKRQGMYKPTDVGNVVRTVVSWYEDVADDKQIQLKVDVPEPVIIQSDPEKLTQALLNLVDNAIKYTDRGSVCVRAICLDQHRIEISVRDTGIGIEKPYQGMVFERLYRVDDSRNASAGYGLGLSLAVAIVDNLGGSIHLESEPGHGSTFTIRLDV